MININNLELSIVELTSEEQAQIKGGVFDFPELKHNNQAANVVVRSIVDPQGIVALDLAIPALG